jgi:hypothetical protein
MPCKACFAHWQISEEFGRQLENICAQMRCELPPLRPRIAEKDASHILRCCCTIHSYGHAKYGGPLRVAPLGVKLVLSLLNKHRYLEVTYPPHLPHFQGASTIVPSPFGTLRYNDMQGCIIQGCSRAPCGQYSTNFTHQNGALPHIADTATGFVH